jgi:hypothetical protein
MLCPADNILRQQLAVQQKEKKAGETNPAATTW